MKIKSKKKLNDSNDNGTIPIIDVLNAGVRDSDFSSVSGPVERGKADLDPITPDQQQSVSATVDQQ